MRRSVPQKKLGALARGQILRDRPRKSKTAKHEGAEEHRLLPKVPTYTINFASSAEIGATSRAKILTYRHFFLICESIIQEIGKNQFRGHRRSNIH